MSTAPRENTWLLPFDLSAPRRARALIRSVLEQHLAPDRVAALELSASELGTNAVVHGRPPVTLRLVTTPATSTLFVRDGGNGHVPSTAAMPLEGPSGRGLLIVESLADSCGGEATTDGWETFAVIRNGNDHSA